MGTFYVDDFYVNRCNINKTSSLHGAVLRKSLLTTGSCTDPARNDFWELAVNARSRGRRGLRLGLLYSRKAWSQGLLGQRRT